MPMLPFSFSPPLSPTTLTVINLLGPLIKYHGDDHGDHDHDHEGHCDDHES